MKYKIKNKYNGSVLAYALVIMTVCMIILVSILGYTSSQLKFSANRAEKEKAFQIAEAGIYFYRWYLAHQVSGKPAQEINDFWQEGSALGIAAPYEDEFEDPEGGAIGKYSLEVQPPEPGSTIVIVKSTGWTYKEPNLKRTVQVRFRRPSWSEYAVLANHFMRFGQGTNVYGKIHCNEGIRFDGVAHNIVSSLMGAFDDPDHTGGNEFGVHTHVNPPPGTGVNDSFRSGEAPPTDPVPTRSDIFLASRQFPISEVSFTGVTSDLNLIKETACDYNGSDCTVVNDCANDGCYFDGSGYGRRIVFNTNGTMSVSTVNNYEKDTYDVPYGRVLFQGFGTITSQSAATVYNIPDNGIIFVEDNVWLEGSINGKRITVAAADLISGATASTGNIFLGATNLLYTNLDGQDIIGVVAQNNIEIIKNSQNNLTLDAALLAQNGRVGRKYYTCNTWKYETCTRPLVNGNCVWPGQWRDWTIVTPSDPSDDVQRCKTYNSKDSKNSITVNGSLATNLRYGFAYTDNSGYITRNLNFDNNLLYFPPPYFPTGTEYAIDLWEEL
jgi:hypothetical protein